MRDKHANSKVGERGFSLVELLVAMGILALILAAIETDTRRATTSFEFRALTIQMAVDLRKARTTAIANSRDVGFAFNASERWYQVDGRDRIPIPASAQMTLVTAKSYVRSIDDARLVFFRDGSSTGGTITLLMDKVRQSISIDWLTGRVQLEPPLPSG
ncbi:GspH/FimT family pseudopilin [Hyphomicrobium sp.]|uniref:GspH/FimT family pseudopilin n=1 Tax=Hyphomicrobium sp. TaxID=82 RepID=UPI003F6F0647